MARTLIRHKDVRLVLPQTPATDKTEDLYAQGRYFEADCLATDAEGDFVYFTGDPVAGFPQVTKVDYEDSATFPASGVIVEKTGLTRCFVQTFGLMTAVGLTANQTYWIGSDSRLADTPPTRLAGQVIYTQPVGVAMSTTQLLMKLPPIRYGLRGD